MHNDKVIKISLIFVTLMVIVGFLGIKLVLKDDMKYHYTSSPTVKKATNTSTDPSELSLDTINININSSKYRLLRADIALKMRVPEGKKALQLNMEAVRNLLLKYLNSMDANGLESVEGKERLKAKITEMIEDAFGQKVEAVYLKNFILSP